MVRSGARGQSGVTLVELIAALFVLGILLTGLSNTLINVLDLSRNNAARVIAANLAAGAIEEIRVLPFNQLADLAASDPDPTWTESVDDIDFTLTRSLDWNTNLADPGPCLGSLGPDDSNIIVIRVEVTWVRPRNIPAVTSETAISPPVSPDSSSSGTVAVFVSDYQTPPQPVANVQVTLEGPLGGASSFRSELTDVNGCAVFQGLVRGNYEASLDKSDHIDIDQRVAPEVTRRIGTAPRLWARLEFRYAEAGEVTAEPEGWFAGSELPIQPMPYYLSNQRDSSPFRFASTDDTGLLFPGLYDIAVAYCSDTDVSPRLEQNTVTVPAAGSVDSPVVIGAFGVEWSAQMLSDLADTDATARTVELVALPPQGPPAEVDECYEDLDELPLGAITEGELGRSFALPFSEGWRIAARLVGVELDLQVVDIVTEDVDDALPMIVFDYSPSEPEPAPEACGGLYAPLDSGIIQAEGGATQVVEIDGWDYCLHTFTQVGSDEFVVSEPGDGLAYLVVGGGGSGGGSGNVGAAGGGGAGRVIYGVRSEAVEAGSYAVVVGAGGAAQTNNNRGHPGEDSSLAAPFAVATGGGGGGRGGGNGDGLADGGPGGSGGGGGRSGAGGSAADGATGNLGNPGARGHEPNPDLRAGGGGGGAQTPGTPAATDGSAGDGGAGLDLSVFGLGTIAGGGGGGARAGNPAGDGASGGGDGGAGGAGGTAAPNTGSGGGGAGGPGSGDNQPGGAGGSGVIVVRYPLQAGAPQPLPSSASATCNAPSLLVDTAGSNFMQVPAGCTQMTVQAWGAGGGGGQPEGSFSPAGSGGGGGAYAGGVFAVTPGDSVEVTVGSGGAPEAAGGTTSVAGFVEAAGGGAGLAGPGAGGSAGASTGQQVFSGGSGGTRGTFGSGGDFGGGGGGGSSASPTSDGVAGGDGTFYLGGAGGQTTGGGDGGRGGDDDDAETVEGAPPENRQAGDGVSPGGGGGGRGWFTGTSAAPGADGRVVITWS